jgi:hypothetical protein
MSTGLKIEKPISLTRHLKKNSGGRSRGTRVIAIAGEYQLILVYP